jgi:hypothetical protein
MGQAKERKRNDPTYGKPSKMRGLIISCPIEIDDDMSFSVRSPFLDKQDLRSSLLYWDRLAWPTGFIGFAEDPDTTFLESSGILLRPNYRIGGTGAEVVIKPQMIALDEFERKSPGVWSLGQSENSILLKSGVGEPSRGTLLSLLNCLPVPSEDVALSDIIDFKTKRRDELLAFREHLENLVDEIQSHHDSEAALMQKLKEMDAACADVITVAREWQLPVKLSNLKASFNFDLAKAATDAAKVWSSSEVFNLGHTSRAIAAGAAALSSQLKISRDFSLRSFRRERSPFSYVHEARQILI